MWVGWGRVEGGETQAPMWHCVQCRTCCWSRLVSHKLLWTKNYFSCVFNHRHTHTHTKIDLYVCFSISTVIIRPNTSAIYSHILAKMFKWLSIDWLSNWIISQCGVCVCPFYFFGASINFVGTYLTSVLRVGRVCVYVLVCMCVSMVLQCVSTGIWPKASWVSCLGLLHNLRLTTSQLQILLDSPVYYSAAIVCADHFVKLSMQVCNHFFKKNGVMTCAHWILH